jgi:GTP diphosphokinase / guanosine-3',5'-bis(diphosphate) 3'-diphosphatase
MRRKSGEPYIYHPIAVAHICAEEIGLGTTSIVCALLHDVVEDTDLTIEDIARLFSPKEAKIIDGLTKISGVSEQGSSMQAENFRKMLLTLSDDVRVILIKLADRLHNMRTLGSMPQAKQLKIASETLYLYAPLAHRLGLNAVKTDLENLGLKYTEPGIYNEIEQRLKESEPERKKYIAKFINPLKLALENQGLSFKIYGRPKSIFSIVKKIKNKGVAFNEIFDLFAIRIVVDSKGDHEKSDCWRVYSTVTDLYYPSPDRLRDWVSSPKANGYESLHTTVMGPEGKWVEVQIRTTRMDDVAEKGYAAHWKYKDDSTESQLDDWIRKIRTVLESSEENAMEFLDNFKLNLFTKEIFVFTPKGELKTLPLHATALDFAFEIHTEVGNRCIGAKVNQKMVPLRHELKSGDQVQIITSQKQTPKEEWLNFVVSAQAKSKISHSLKEAKKTIALQGKDILEAKCKELNIDFTTANANQLTYYFKLPSKKELCYRLAMGTLDANLLNDFYQEKDVLKHKTGDIQKNEPLSQSIEDIVKEAGGQSDMLIIGENIDSFDYKLSPCCNPIAGDDVFGFVTSDNGIQIHRVNCTNAVELLASKAYRVITAKWTTRELISFLAGIEIKGIDEHGIVNTITRIISNELNVSMRSINFESKDGTFEGRIKVYVHDTTHLTQLINKLKKVEGIVSVNRIGGF